MKTAGILQHAYGAVPMMQRLEVLDQPIKLLLVPHDNITTSGRLNGLDSQLRMAYKLGTSTHGLID